MGLFSKEKTPNLDFRAVNRMDRDNFFQMLTQQGWTEIENAFEFDKNWDVDRVRKAAKGYALKIGAEMLVEMDDPAFSSNPYNDLVYYVFKRGGQSQPASYDQQDDTKWQNQQQMQAQSYQYPTYPRQNVQNQWAQQSVHPQGSYDPRAQVVAQPPVGRTPPREIAKSSRRSKNKGIELHLKPTYSTYSEALVDCLSNISKMLCMNPCPLPFRDDREYIGQSVLLAKPGYNHMGVRMMDLVLVNPEKDVYNVLGNEGHDPNARRVHYMRDNLIIIKTQGLPRFDMLPDFDRLEENQKADIAKSVYSFLEMYLPKF